MIVKRQCEIRFLADAISVEGRVFNLPSECTLVRESDYDLLAAELAEAKRLYYELIYQVANVHPGESRHETALRYLKQAEMPSPDNCGSMAAQEKGVM